MLIRSTSHPPAILFLLFAAASLVCSSTPPAQELLRGFTATPDPSVSSFQSLLQDSTGNFSLGFLRLNSNQLALAVLHVPSNEPIWLANLNQLVRWSDRTQLLFNGSLVISDPITKVFWSTETDGNRVVLLNSSNLQIQNSNASPTVPWQSFDFPTNTLVENQNFTSTMSLVSSNGLYSMRLGNNFIGLYAKFEADTELFYWRHRALEAKANIVEGGGPIYVRVNPDGYLGMYQNGSTPVDVEAFSSFQRNNNGFLMVRLEPDGNLKGYYWDGSTWVLDYQAISDPCELPSPCGPYSLCTPGSGCSCLDNRTEISSGRCHASYPDNLCGVDGGEPANNFNVLRKNGVELPFKELMTYQTTSSQAECEGLCEKNCSCYGSVYNNGSRFCYLVDYPIQSLLSDGDESKMGYFKISESARKRKMTAGLGVGIGLLGGAIVCLIAAVGVGSYRMWRRRRRVKRMLEEEDGGAIPGRYKNLGSGSFRSIEMT
ncbi:hypothetical protein SLE2022_123800 [Rubroshorea leprosula]